MSLAEAAAGSAQHTNASAVSVARMVARDRERAIECRVAESPFRVILPVKLVEGFSKRNSQLRVLHDSAGDMLASYVIHS
jgi:hypothetical protein